MKSFFWGCVILWSTIPQPHFSNCQLLEQFFKDPVFYSRNHGINIEGTDTLVVFDGGGYFSDCQVNDVNGKKITISPMPNAKNTYYYFLNDIAANDYHFIIKEISQRSDTFRIDFFKKHSNHNGYLEYVIQGGSFVKLKDEIGQY